MKKAVQFAKAFAALIGCPVAGCIVGFVLTAIYLQLTHSDFIGDGILILFVCGFTSFVGLAAGIALANDMAFGATKSVEAPPTAADR